MKSASVTEVDRQADTMQDVLRRIGQIERLGHTHAAPIGYLPLTGGAITGNLSVSGTLSTVGNISSASRMDLTVSSGEAIRLIGDASFISFYSAGAANRRGYLQGNTGGLFLASESGVLTLNGIGGVTMSPFIINGYTASTGQLGNRIVLTDANGYIFGSYINMTANIVYSSPTYFAGQNGDNYLRWYAQSSFDMSIANMNTSNAMYASGNISGGSTYGRANGTAWNTGGLLTNSGAGNAIVGLHCGGTAPVIGTTTATGNNIYFRDGSFSPYSSTCVAAGFTSDSSQRWKKNIARWPMLSLGAAAMSALDRIARLKPVTFQAAGRDVQVPSLRRANAHTRLNEYLAAKDRPLYELPEHDCAVHECNGTTDDPCMRKMQHEAQRVGFLAEDMVEVVPEVVMLDADRKPAGIDYGLLTAVCVAGIQELVARVELLEGSAR